MRTLEPERCAKCDDYTGHAGAADDSLFCPCGDGPFCCDCWAEHARECPEHGRAAQDGGRRSGMDDRQMTGESGPKQDADGRRRPQ